MTVIDGIFTPNKPSQISESPSNREVSGGEKVDSYAYLKASINNVVAWVERSQDIVSRKSVDTIHIPTKAMGATVIPMQSALKSFADIFIVPEKLAEIAETLRFYFTTISTFVWFALNTLAYRVYVAAVELMQLAADLPRSIRRSLTSIQEIAYILNTKDLRELAFIEWKLSLKLFTRQLSAWIQNLLGLGKKYYLATMVLGALVTTGISSVASGSASFLQSASTRHALASAIPVYGAGSSNLLSRDVINLRKTAPRSFILEHEVKKGETVAYLSSLYGVSEETIKFNNSISGDELKVGSKVYIPPLDAYILIASENTNTQDISRVYKVDKQDLVAYNPLLGGDGADGLVEKGKVVMVPVSNFDLVKRYQQEEQDRLKEEERKTQAAQFRAQALAGAAYKKLDFLDKDRVADLNFGLPVDPQYNAATTYWGHINNAVDFGGGNSNPPIYAVSGGVVVEVQSGLPDVSCVGSAGCFQNGYANFVTIDHGGGYKTRYAHLHSVNVQIGQEVKKGQMIGLMGQAGYAFGIHLHFEVLKDDYGVYPPYVIPGIRMK